MPTPPAPPDTSNTPTEEMPIEDMLRIMDVATTLRRERERATAELDVEQTRAFLRKKLTDTAQATGETVTEAEIEAAIAQYYRSLHAYEPPKRGWRTFLAHLYIRRVPILWFMFAVAVTTALIWWAFFSSTGPFSEQTRERRALVAAQQREADAEAERVAAAAQREQDLATAVQRVENVERSLRSASMTGAAEAALRPVLEDAAAARAAEDPLRLSTIAGQLEGLRNRIVSAFEIHVVNPSIDSGDSGVRIDVTATGTISGHYLIVEARDPKTGVAITRTIRDAKSGERKSVKRWAELVPLEVFNRLGADKGDGILDETLVAIKRSGTTEPDVVMRGADGAPLTLKRQLASWPQ